jgi:NAD(P)H-dependent FMN reductase
VSARLVVALNGSPLRDSSVDLLLGEVLAGAVEAGGFAQQLRCVDLKLVACMACGPEPTQGLCIFRDDMDKVYALLEAAHAVVVGSPVYFDTVSAPLKMVMDRCNCVTPLVRLPDGTHAFRPRWQRTRRGLFVTTCGERQAWDLAERTTRGFMKWVGVKWEETIAFAHDDVELGSVKRDVALLAKARAAGHRLVTSDPLVPQGSA